MNITTTNGTRQTHFVRWMDLNIEVRNISDGGGTESYDNVYAKPGTYDVEVYVYNCKSFFSYVIKVVVVQPIVSCDLHLDTYHEMSISDGRAEVSFNRTKVNGTHTYDMYDYADKWVLVTYEETYSPIYNVSHNYTTPGEYNVTLRCYNRYTYMSEKKLIYVQYPILNLMATTETYHTFGNDVIIDWSYENGSAVGVTVTLDGVDASDQILFADSDQRSGNLTIPTGQAGADVGMHTVVITCTNFVSGTVTKTVVYYVEKAITGLAFTANGVASQLYVTTVTDVTIVATVTDGSNITYTYNNGLMDVVQTTDDRSDTRFPAYQYTTSQTNYYVVTLLSQNNVSNASASMTIGAENPIPTITFTNTNETDASNKVAFTITPTESSEPEPTNIVFSLKYGDEADNTYTDVDVPFTVVPSSSTTHTITHTYNYGHFDAEIFIRNNVSNITLHTNVMVGLGIQGFNVELVESNNCFDPGSPVKFNVSKTQGTNITYTYTWGHDNQVESEQSDASPFTKAHTFPANGSYQVTFRAANTFDSTEVQLAVKMVYNFPPSIEFVAGEVTNIVPGNYPFEIKRTAGEHSPTNATCNMYEGSTSLLQFDLDLGADHTLAGSLTKNPDFSSKGLGSFDYHVNCSTCNGEKSWPGTVFLQQMITNLQLSVESTANLPAQNVCVTATVGTGSHVTFIGKFDTNNSVVIYDASAKTAQLCCPYNTDDNHTIEVRAMNQLVNETSDIDVIIQYPITQLQLVVRGGNTIVSVPAGGTEDVIFDLTILGGRPNGPTNAFCSWTQYEGATAVVLFATELRNLGTHSHTFTFTPSTPLGNQRVTVNCSNLVSSQSAYVDLILQVPITSIKLKNSSNPIGIRKVMNYTIEIEPKWCSHVWVFWTFGDGNTSVQYYEGLLTSNPSIQHSYVSEGVYVPSVEVWNIVTNNMTDTLPENVTVLKSLIYEDFTFMYTTPQPRPATLAVRVDTSFSYIDTAVTFNWGVNSKTTVVPMSVTWPVLRNFTYENANDAIGNVTFSVKVENEVSEIEFTGWVIIQQVPSGANIVLNDYYSTNQAITGELTFTEGSHLTMEVACSPLGGAPVEGCSAPHTNSTEATSLPSWTFPLSFSKPGQYNVKVNVSNDFGFDVATKVVNIQNVIVGFSVDSQDDPAHTGGDYYTIQFRGSRDTNLTMRLKVTNACSSPPTDVTMSRFVDYPRDVANVTEDNVSVALSCTPHSVSRPFGEIGDYVVKVDVANQVSSGTYTFYVKVIEAIGNDFNITVASGVPPDSYGKYKVRDIVHITASHGALADYNHIFYLSWNCDDNKNPLMAEEYSENCAQSTEYANTKDITVYNVSLTHSGVYRVKIVITYPGVPDISAEEVIMVSRVKPYPVKVEKKNADGNYEPETITGAYKLSDIRNTDFRFTAEYQGFAQGSWHIRWYLNDLAVTDTSVLDESLEKRLEAPGTFKFMAQLDGLPNLRPPPEHNQFFNSQVVEITVKSTVDICDVKVPVSGYINEKFEKSDTLFPCALANNIACLYIIEMCKKPEDPLCFEITITDPNNKVHYRLAYGTDNAPCTNRSFSPLNAQTEYNDIRWPEGLKLDKIGVWKINVTATVKAAGCEDCQAVSEIAEKDVNMRCRSCNFPRVVLRDLTGPGSSVNKSVKFPR